MSLRHGGPTVTSVKDIEVKALATTFTKQPTEIKFNSSRTSLNLNQDFHFQEKFSNSEVDTNTWLRNLKGRKDLVR